MTYAAGRVIHDADAHIMETAEWLVPYADPADRDRVLIDGAPTRSAIEADLELSHGTDDLMLRKNYRAIGGLVADDRPAALDELGFRSQLVFNTYLSGAIVRAEQTGDLDRTYAMARAHNRAMLEFCGVDDRLLSTCLVPLGDLEQAPALARDAIEAGASSLLVASAPPGHSPSHVALDGLWAAAAEAGIPVVMHVGGGGRLMDPAYFENGLPPVKDFHGGDGNFKSVDYMAIPYPVMQTLAVLVIDGVLQRFPDLRIGVIEQGASWLPGLMRSLDSAATAFVRNEERLQRMELKPSEYVRRQVRVTPYPHEDAGWVISQAGEETCMFSSDYPHVEGGRHPLKRFDASLVGTSDRAVDRFYSENFVDLMGAGLPAALV
jgi:predicted TIM-barrel fold metal-dependent hydrolase